MDADLIASRYRVMNPIGQGGMGQVYLALDETLKRRVALKAIRADRRLDPEARARFVREARVLSQLDHPPIWRVHDYLSTPEGDWIVLEYVQGATLNAAMRGGVTAAQRLHIARQIAGVLTTTHAVGVVHRDDRAAAAHKTLLSLGYRDVSYLRVWEQQAHVSGDRKLSLDESAAMPVSGQTHDRKISVAQPPFLLFIWASKGAQCACAQGTITVCTGV